MAVARWLGLVLMVGVCQEADGIKCWGGNAITLQREGGEATSCTHRAEKWDLFRYDRPDVCYEKCAGVTWFEGFSTGNRPFANPAGKRLCPGVVDKDECNCEAWPELLTPSGACPQCDDYDTLPPLIRTRNMPTASRSKWATLEECPPEYDMCVNYCYHDPKFKGSSTWCFFGCAKSSSKQALTMAIASQLSSLDYQRQWKQIGSIFSDYHPPNMLFCKQDTFDCQQTFCQSDACNPGPGYTYKYIKNRFWRHWPPLVLILLVVLMIVIFGVWPWLWRLVGVRILGYPDLQHARKNK